MTNTTIPMLEICNMLLEAKDSKSLMTANKAFRLLGDYAMYKAMSNKSRREEATLARLHKAILNFVEKHQ